MIETIQDFYDFTTASDVVNEKISYDEAILVVDEFCSEYND